jgi:hypothetical protein
MARSTALVRLMSACARSRSLLLGGSTAALALMAGCGSSSTGKSTQSSSQSITPSTPQATAPSSAAQSSSPSISAAGATVTGVSGGVTATLHASTHHPKVARAWPIRFTVTRAGRPARASVSYEYLFAGQVVAHRSHYTFTGRFSDVFRWPASAVGYPLSFRAVIVAGGATINLDYPVQVTA